jgi:hypothetical protein
MIIDLGLFSAGGIVNVLRLAITPVVGSNGGAGCRRPRLSAGGWHSDTDRAPRGTTPCGALLRFVADVVATADADLRGIAAVGRGPAVARHTVTDADIDAEACTDADSEACTDADAEARTDADAVTVASIAATDAVAASARVAPSTTAPFTAADLT